MIGNISSRDGIDVCWFGNSKEKDTRKGHGFRYRNRWNEDDYIGLFTIWIRRNQRGKAPQRKLLMHITMSMLKFLEKALQIAERELGLSPNMAQAKALAVKDHDHPSHLGSLLLDDQLEQGEHSSEEVKERHLETELGTRPSKIPQKD